MGRQTMFQVITPSAVSLRLSSNDQEDDDLDLSDLPDADDSGLDLSDLPDATPQPPLAPINKPGPSAPQFDINTASDLERLAAGYGPKEEEQSTLGKAWDWYNKPISDFPSQVGRKLSNLIDPQRGTTGLRSIASAYVEGLGDVATGMLSPSNLTPIGAGYGAAKTGLSALSKAAKGASGLQAIHGGQEVIRPDATLFERGMGALEAFLGARGIKQDYLPKPKSTPPPVVDPTAPVIPENFGPEAYAGPERRNAAFRSPENAADKYFAEYRERLARGEDVRSAESKKLLEKKTATDTARKSAKIVERNGKFYEQTGVNPDTNQPTYKEIPKPADQKLLGHPVEVRGTEAPPPTRYEINELPEGDLGVVDTVTGKILKRDNNPDTVEAYIKTLKEQPIIDVGKTPTARTTNASGESAASTEAINRGNSMANAGEQFVVYDRAGNGRPMSAIDGRDYNPAKGETLVIEGPNGRVIQTANGGKVPRNVNQRIPTVRTSGLNQLSKPITAGGDTVYAGKVSKARGMKASAKKPKTVPIFGSERLGELADKATAGTITAEELAEARKLQKQLKETIGKLPVVGETPPAAGAPPNVPPSTPLKPAPTGGTPPPGGSKPISHLANVTNVAKTMKSSMDLSAPLRQGLPLIHKKAWWTSIDDMVKAWGSKGAYDRIMDEIINDPSGYFKPKIDPVTGLPGKSFAEEMGLDLTDIVNRREETMLSTLADKVPGIARSNRAYVAFLNKLRADTFKSLINDVAKADPNFRNNTVVSKNLAKFVNNATGRGSLGGMEEAANVLNGLVFSPRLMAANLNRLNPVNYVATSNKGARMEYLKSAIAQATAWTTMAALASEFGGADVSLDPTNSDFGKIKMGNSRMDPSGGMQTYLVALARMTPKAVGKEVKELTGWSDARTGVFTSPGNPNVHQDYGKGFPPRSKFDVGVDFGFNKAAPPARFAGELLKATGYKPFNVSDQVVRMFTPMIIEDMIELYKDDPDNMWMLGPDFAGMGVQTFTDEKPAKKGTLLGYPEPWVIK